MTTIIICKTNKKETGFLEPKTNPDKIKVIGKSNQMHSLSVISFCRHAIPTVCMAVSGASPSVELQHSFFKEYLVERL